MSGRLVVVGTPIGNLADLSDRAREELSRADIIACEDTRRTGRLLSLIGLAAPRLVRMDDHTEGAVATQLLEEVRRGAAVAIVSDAGMPALSDPGALLIDAAIDAGLHVEVVPGPFAAAVALVASGMLSPTGRFCFEGFLPRRGSARAERLAELRDERRTIVLYESPHRIEATIADLIEVMGPQRRVALCRELTKMHEEVRRSTLAEAAAALSDTPARGEYVVVLDGAADPAPVDDDRIIAELRTELDRGTTRRDAAERVAAELGVARNRVKRLLAGLG